MGSFTSPKSAYWPNFSTMRWGSNTSSSLICMYAFKTRNFLCIVKENGAAGQYTQLVECVGSLKIAFKPYDGHRSGTRVTIIAHKTRNGVRSVHLRNVVDLNIFMGRKGFMKCVLWTTVGHSLRHRRKAHLRSEQYGENNDKKGKKKDNELPERALFIRRRPHSYTQIFKDQNKTCGTKSDTENGTLIKNVKEIL